MNENTKFLEWLLLPGFGCWSLLVPNLFREDQTTALPGEDQRGLEKPLPHSWHHGYKLGKRFLYD